VQVADRGRQAAFVVVVEILDAHLDGFDRVLVDGVHGFAVGERMRDRISVPQPKIDY
jgi:hypothetical protein